MTQSAERHLQGKLGARLRALRIEYRLSVRTLAARTGFSPSFISQVEADAVSPSLMSLEKIAAELGVTLAQLFSSLEDVPRTVIRADQRTTYTSAWSHSTVAVLTDPAGGRKLSGIIVTFDPGGMSGMHGMPLHDDTFVLLLSGTLTVTLDDEPYVLSAGDTLYLQQGTRCRWTNTNPQQATVLLVGSTGLTSLLPSAFLEEAATPDV
jgi:transcriptional regulator with XRE-family HTH domain